MRPMSALPVALPLRFLALSPNAEAEKQVRAIESTLCGHHLFVYISLTPKKIKANNNTILS